MLEPLKLTVLLSWTTTAVTLSKELTIFPACKLTLVLLSAIIPVCPLELILIIPLLSIFDKVLA